MVFLALQGCLMAITGIAVTKLGYLRLLMGWLWAVLVCSTSFLFFFSRPECRVGSSDIYGNHKASCSNPGVFSEVL